MLEVLPTELELRCAQDNSDSGSFNCVRKRQGEGARPEGKKPGLNEHLLCVVHGHRVYIVISLNRVTIVCSFDGRGNEGSEVMGCKAPGITGKGCRGELTTRL